MNNNLSNIKKSKFFLDKGHCVAIPTETVYGLAANAYSDNAVKKIYKLKQYVNYPQHGVGKITDIKKTKIGGIEVDSYFINFEKEKAELEKIIEDKKSDKEMIQLAKKELNELLEKNKTYEKILELNGVGFRATVQGNKLNLQIGLSHPVEFEIPKEIKITVEKQTIIKIFGIDKQLVGSVAADIKSLRPVEPHKGKGIKEKGQYVLRKEGKKK